jgi:hypothetical protein
MCISCNFHYILSCEIGKRQTREHLFKECLHWKNEIKELWRKVQRETGWRNVRWKPISALFDERKATGTILDVLDKTGVGKMRDGVNPEDYDED